MPFSSACIREVSLCRIWLTQHWLFQSCGRSRSLPLVGRVTISGSHPPSLIPAVSVIWERARLPFWVTTWPPALQWNSNLIPVESRWKATVAAWFVLLGHCLASGQRAASGGTASQEAVVHKSCLCCGGVDWDHGSFPKEADRSLVAGLVFPCAWELLLQGQASSLGLSLWGLSLYGGALWTIVHGW